MPTTSLPKCLKLVNVTIQQTRVQALLDPGAVQMLLYSKLVYHPGIETEFSAKKISVDNKDVTNVLDAVSILKLTFKYIKVQRDSL